MRIVVVILAALACLAAPRAGVAADAFEEALNRGALFLAPSHAVGENDQIIAHLAELNPGYIEGFGFLWGGPTMERLDYVAATAAKIRAKLPQVLMSGAFSEGIRADYDESLRCGGAMGDRRFTVAELTANRRQGNTSIWLDMSKPATSEFYECVGQIYIDMGLTVIRFEAPTLVLRNSSNPAAAAQAYGAVVARLRAYAASKGLAVYFVGDPDLARYVSLDAVFIPSRFYHTTLQSALKYQNKIARPGIGVGYSYALSPLIVRDTVAEVGRTTKVMFAVDNWDPTQDDLRRFMELDPENRHTLIVQSARNARRGGAYFVPPLDGCGGCTPRDAVVDPCEVQSNNSTEYNAVRCNDIAVIRRALRPWPQKPRETVAR